MKQRVWVAVVATALLSAGAASAGPPVPVLRLAYVSPADTALRQRASLWAVDADGTHRARLLHGFASLGAPVWSPDGRRVALIVCHRGVDTCGGPALEVVDAASGKATVLERRLDDPIAWSADGRTLLVERQRAGTSDFVYSLVGLDGRVRTIPRATAGASFSPSGKQVVFQTTPGLPLTGNIGVYDVATRRVRLLTRDGYDQDPVWSPDGARVAYVNIASHDVPEVVDADGSHRRTFASPAGDSVDDLEWISTSAVGLRRLRNSTNPGPARIYVLDVRTGGTRRVATGTQSIAWSPSGTELAYSADAAPNRAPRSIYVTPTTGKGTPRRVTHVDWADSPVWSPDGRALAVDSNDDPDVHGVAVVFVSGASARLIDLGRGGAPAWRPLRPGS